MNYPDFIEEIIFDEEETTCSECGKPNGKIRGEARFSYTAQYKIINHEDSPADVESQRQYCQRMGKDALMKIHIQKGLECMEAIHSENPMNVITPLGDVDIVLSRYALRGKPILIIRPEDFFKDINEHMWKLSLLPNR